MRLVDRAMPIILAAAAMAIVAALAAMIIATMMGHFA